MKAPGNMAPEGTRPLVRPRSGGMWLWSRQRPVGGWTLVSMTELSAGRPLERPPHRVGRRTITLFDPERANRQLSVELWYPAAGPKAPLTTYEVFPGVAFHSATAEHEAAAMAGYLAIGVLLPRTYGHTHCLLHLVRGAGCSGRHRGRRANTPVTLWPTGWSATHSDDRTNEVNRVADAHLVLGALLRGHRAVPVDLLNAIHHDRVVLAGHSYGAFTAFATAAGSRGVAPHEHIRAVIGYQPYTRTMSDALLGRVSVPALLVVSGQDRVAPPRVDAERPWALLPGRPLWRLRPRRGRPPGRQRCRPLRRVGVPPAPPAGRGPRLSDPCGRWIRILSMGAPGGT